MEYVAQSTHLGRAIVAISLTGGRAWYTLRSQPFMLLPVYAVLVALCTLFLIVTGAAVTSEGFPATHAIFSLSGHRAVASGVGILTIGLMVWIVAVEKRSWLRRLVWLPLAGMAVEFGLGELAGPAALGASMAHAFLAPLVLATVAATALAASAGWRREPVTIQDKGWPPMGSLATTTLVFVVIQVALGAAFRYGVLGVLPHILGALVVVLLILTLVICMTQLAEHPTLRPAAIVLLVLTFLQIFLGLTLLSMGAVTGAKFAAVILGITHVALGAVTLTTSVVVMLELRRCVRK